MFEKNKTTYANEQHRFNSLMYIIDREINNVVMKLKSAKKAETKTVDIDLPNQVHTSAEYNTKKKDINKNLEELW